ncbi:MAG TPA: trigger factor, partial [Rhodospirillaceae bacterium]|nr:trigger factor [Rhodospirillaceae bacterium]
KVEVTQEELQQAVFRQAQRYPGQEREVFEYFTKSPEMMNSLRAPIFEEKTVDYILELATVTDVSLPVDQLLESDDDSTEGEEGKKAKKSAKKSSAKKAASKKAAAKKSAD